MRVYTYYQIVLLKWKQKLDEHFECVVERTIIVELKHTKVHIAAAQTPLEYIEADRDAFEFHGIDLIFGCIGAGHEFIEEASRAGRLSSFELRWVYAQYAVAVRADETRGLAEQQDAVRWADLEDETLRAVLHELGHELENGRRDERLVVPDLDGFREERQIARIQPLE